MRDEGAAEGGLEGRGLEGVQGTVEEGDGGLTLPAPAGPMTSTPNLDIVKGVVVEDYI